MTDEELMTPIPAVNPATINAYVFAYLAANPPNVDAQIAAYLTAHPIVTPHVKVKNETRVMTAATGDIAYTGYGFQPDSIIIYALNNTNTNRGSIGWSDPNKAVKCINYDDGYGGVQFETGKVVDVQDASSTAKQTAIVKSYDADGFTLTWTKAGSPTSTILLMVIAFKNG